MAKKMKLFEKIFLFTVAAATTATMVAIPVNSYMEYQEYLAGLEQAAPGTATKKPVLEKIEANLVEGVQYFANDMAEAKAEDFEVIAHYTVEGEEPYTEVVEASKLSVQTAADFYAKGGDVTISFRGKVATVPVTLVPVTLESINVTMNPYTIKYAAGSTFNNAGMIINAVYNDGSTKVLSADEYVVDTETALTMQDKFVSVSYTDGGVEKTVDVEIGVSETLDNGDVESIIIVDGAIVNAGEYITDAVMEVNAVYESGNRVPLTSEEYTVNGLTEAVDFGKMYELEVVYGADTTKKATTDVVVRQTVQGEDGVIVGGAVKTETEYKIIDGVITETENSVTFAGNFSNSVKNGNEGSLTLSVNSATETVGDVTMRCSNSYNVYANGTNADGGYMMKPLQINTILDLTVNGREVKVPTTVILKGCGPWESYAPLYGIYYEFTFEDIELDAGLNEIKFNFKNSTVGAANCWGESPSTLNIDYVNIDSIGSEIPENYTITAIEVSEIFAPDYAQNFEDIEVPFIATLDNGTRIGLDSSLVNVEIVGGAEGDTYFKFGEYTINASLKSNPEVKTSTTVTIEEFTEFTVLNADVEVENDKVYYVFSGNSVGYTAEQLEFFDGATNYEFTVDFTATEFKLKIDVTDIATGTQIYPHMNVDGSKYDNGANGNGDVRGNGLTYEDGKSVTFGAKTYTIVTAWSMPTLLVEQYVDPSTATEIKIADSYEAKFGDALADIPVIAIIEGDEVALKNDAYTIEIVGNETATTLGEGTYTIKVTLNGTELTDEMTVTLADPNKKFYDAELNDEFVSEKTLVNTFVHGSEGMETNGKDQNSEYEGGTGGIDQIDRHVTYTFTLTEDGYVDIIFNAAGNYWSGGNNQGLTDMANNITVTIDGKSIDVSGIALPAGDGETTNVWWNVKQIVIKDVALAAGEHIFKAVCITKGAGLNVGSMELYFEAGEIPDEPIVPDQPTEPEYEYDADLDNEYASEKTLLGEYVYGSEGVDTNGSDKNSEYTGGIGGMDKVDKYVTYTFTVEEDGKVDFIWNIAGSAWNGSGNSGLTDAGNHISVTIDGKKVDVAGIALPAGEGDNAWWNVQQVIVKDVALTAGEHTFSCTITTDGSGLNIGSMEIYFAANTSVDPEPTPDPVEKEILVTGADIVVDGEKVYYVFTFKNVGYTVADYEFFDGETVYAIADSKFEGETAIIKIDVTALEVGATIDPHLRVAGANYVNGANGNGDLRGDALVYEQKVIQANGKLYQLYGNWAMPSLKIVELAEKVCIIIGADLVVEGDKVYLLYTYANVGYDPSKYEFFNNSFILAHTYEVDGVMVTFKMDVTDITEQFYPHLRIDGVTFDGSSNGDVKLDTNQYTNNKTVELNGKSYKLENAWGMPTVKLV